MRKRILLFIATLVLLLPIVVKAESKTLDSHKTLDLKETLKEEGIEISDSKYKETDDQVVIYMFRGKGCAYCRAFLEFINSQLSENGKMFKVRTLEVWYDKKNSKLLSEIADFLGEEAGGVPFIIIGEKVFPGYAPDWNDDIINAIKDEYNKKAKDRYDVFVEYDKTQNTESSVNTKKIIGWTVGSVAVALVIVVILQAVIIVNNNNKFNAIFDALNIERKLSNKEIKELEEKEEVKPTKKSKKK